ncbi:hypothetical protein ACIBG8_23775 [Nonomuraea sp. NPDC050556]|uniref:hypothetical protein n=1 Tax=Nonomuraea sp. NPDC050556 TaxID=3364369 RepID=UPI0037B67781
MAPEPQGDFAGIDPVQLKAMINDLEDTKSLVEQKIPTLTRDFGRVGLESKNLTTLTGVAGWIGGETPMLKRRQSMAEQISKENNQYGFTGNMVETEWTGLFKTKEEAKQYAEDLASTFDKYKGFDKETWAEIEKYQNDPDFAEAFVKAMGAENMFMALRASSTAKKGKQDEDALKAIATLMATASHRGVIDDKFLEQFAEYGGGGPHLDAIATLVQYGTWNKDTLVKIGQKGLSADMAAGGNYRFAKLLDGIARNPIAASELYSKEFDKINAIIRGKAFGFVNMDDDKIGDPLGRFVTAATAGAHDVYERMRYSQGKDWQNPADALTKRVLEEIHKNKKDVTEFAGVRHAYVAIIETYFEDLKGSTTSMVPEYWAAKDGDPGRPGIELPPDVWATITEQAMLDPKNAAELNVFFAGKYKEDSDRIAGGENPDFKDANNLSNYQNGQLKGWFLKRYEAAKAAAEKDVEDYNAEVDKWVGLFVDTAVAAGTAAAAGPAAGAAAGAASSTSGADAAADPAAAGPGAGGAAATAGKDAISGFVQDLGVEKAKKWIGDIWHKDMPKYDVDTDWAGSTTAYQDKARALYEAGKVPPVKDPDVTWKGDPSLYEDLYGGKFTEDGKIKPMDDLKKDPAALRAYEQWLKDPAVQNATWNEFSSDQQGTGASN